MSRSNLPSIFWRHLFFVIPIALLLDSQAVGQLRIVSLNASNTSSQSSGPRVGMGTILSSIGSTVSDDPTLPGNTGIIKPLDVLLLQEYRSPATTGAAYAALLNQTYGTTSFSFGTTAGATAGSGSQGIVYNSSTVQLISEAVVGNSGTMTQPRETLRHQIRPVGYGSSADIYIYNGHWKAGSSSSDEVRRTMEANAIRADVNTNIPAGANVIYCGDFNVSSSSDDSIVALTAPGNGQAFDPINKMDWSSTAAFKNVHTQSPWGSSVDPSNGFTGSAGGMDDRFDFQMITNNLRDGRGTAYITNSYQAHGNNGSHQLDQPLNSGSGADASTLFYLSSIIDHLPIVADYQLPARLGVSVGSVPQRVIVGANVNVDVTVTNTAPVMFSNGADGLTYTVSGAGDVSGNSGATDKLALTAGNVHTLNMSTATPGLHVGTINASSTSEAVANGTFSQSVSTVVLGHATPSFQPDADVNTATIDFGIRGKGLGDAADAFALINLNQFASFTAKLDLDSIDIAGDTSSITTDLATFANLAGAGFKSYDVNFSDDVNGTFEETYTLNFSDEDVPGATARGPLTLVVKGIIATPGDADLNGVINFDDYARIDLGFNNSLSGWSNGDFDGNGAVDFDDYALIDLNFNNQLNGGQAVPEPASVSWLIGVVGMCLSRGRRGIATVRQYSAE